MSEMEDVEMKYVDVKSQNKGQELMILELPGSGAWTMA